MTQQISQFEQFVCFHGYKNLELVIVLRIKTKIKMAQISNNVKKKKYY